MKNAGKGCTGHQISMLANERETLTQLRSAPCQWKLKQRGTKTLALKCVHQSLRGEAFRVNPAHGPSLGRGKWQVSGRAVRGIRRNLRPRSVTPQQNPHGSHTEPRRVLTGFQSLGPVRHSREIQRLDAPCHPKNLFHLPIVHHHTTRVPVLRYKTQ